MGISATCQYYDINEYNFWACLTPIPNILNTDLDKQIVLIEPAPPLEPLDLERLSGIAGGGKKFTKKNKKNKKKTFKLNKLKKFTNKKKKHVYTHKQH